MLLKRSAMLATFDAFMNDKNIYTDSNLALARVARRLSARDVSTALNRITDENFSSYDNSFRVRHAQDALRETELLIQEIIFNAGFVSNQVSIPNFAGSWGGRRRSFGRAGKTSNAIDPACLILQF